MSNRENATPPGSAGTVFADLPGHTIAGVLGREAVGRRSPRHQIFLAFSDGTYIEFYSDTPIRTTSRLYAGGLKDIRNAAADGYRVTLEAERVSSGFDDAGSE